MHKIKLFVPIQRKSIRLKKYLINTLDFLYDLFDKIKYHTILNLLIQRNKVLKVQEEY